MKNELKYRVYATRIDGTEVIVAESIEPFSSNRLQSLKQALVMRSLEFDELTHLRVEVRE